MRSSSGDDAAYVSAVLGMFRQQSFYYTLEPPALGVHTVDDFLFETRRGFCETLCLGIYFHDARRRCAGTCRHRLSGWRNQHRQQLSGGASIRCACMVGGMAEGSRLGACRSTAAIAPQRVERGLESAIAESESVPGRTLRRRPWLYQLRQNWDAVNTYWKATIVNFDSDDQRAVMNSLGIKNADWRTLGIALLIAFVSFFIAMMAWLGWRYRPRQRDPVIEAYTALKLRLAKTGVTACSMKGRWTIWRALLPRYLMLAPQCRNCATFTWGCAINPIHQHWR
jgi:hypothetical protein